MRALVCGGREFDDQLMAHRALYRLHRELGFTVIIDGCAPGADTFASEWAASNNILNLRFPITKEDWRRAGNGAGPIRNQKMLDEGKPDIVIYFPGKDGTADMIRRAKLAGVEVRAAI